MNPLQETRVETDGERRSPDARNPGGNAADRKAIERLTPPSDDITKIGRVYRRLNFELNRNLRNCGAKHWFHTRLGEFYLPKPWVSDSILKRILSDSYEKSEIDLLTRFLEPGDSVIELGAGIGFLAKYYCQVSRQQHFAIEASPFLCEVLKSNTATFPNVEIINAVARKSEALNTFYVYEDFWASSLIPVHLSNPACKLTREMRVPSIDLDQLMADNRTNFLICDIEGGEKELFNTFELKVPKILLELHWDVLDFPDAMAILSSLAAKGYALHGQPGFVMAINSAYETSR